MIRGGICHYPGGSQLAAADTFLRAHRGHVLLVTIDIGANDPEPCGSQPGLKQLASCVIGVPDAVANLSTILASLRAAAGAGIRIIGMNYYLPALAEWRDGTAGPGRSPGLPSGWPSATTTCLTASTPQSGDRVANVFGAFDTADFGDQVTVPGIGTVPRNVARICQWTWECAPPPRGPNQHANQAGYQVIANAILQASGLN